AGQFPARRRLNDRPRAGNVAFEIRFEFFDRVQARLGGREFVCDRAVARLQRGNACGSRVAAFVRSFGYRALRGNFGFVFSDEQFAFGESGTRGFGACAELLPFGIESGEFARQTFDIAARARDLRATFGFVRGAFGGERFDGAQFGINRVEAMTRLRDRGRCAQFALAHAVRLRLQRRQAIVGLRDRRLQLRALGFDAVAVGTRG